MGLDSLHGIGWRQDMNSFPTTKIKQVGVPRNNDLGACLRSTFQNHIVIRVFSYRSDASLGRYDLAEIVELFDQRESLVRR